MKKNGKLRFYRSGFWLATVTGIVCLFLCLGLSARFTWNVQYLLLSAAGVYLVILLVYWFIWYRFSAGDPSLVGDELGTDLLQCLYAHPDPACVCREDGSIVWCNTAFITATGVQDVPFDAPINRFSALRPDDFPRLLSRDAGRTVLLGQRLYQVFENSFSEKEEKRYFLSFTDCTEVTSLRQTLHGERAVVAYIVIDNIDEILQFVQERFSKCASDVEERLKAWILSMDGIFRSYERDKYLAVFDVSHLEKVMADRFSILDDIRNVRVGDGIAITVSMGIANVHGSLTEREAAAKAALDLALQRGGDQAVYRSDSGTEFYGGRTKAVYKRNNVRARVLAGQLASLIGRADNVLVMGHRFADFDSVASAVGIARLAMFYGAKVNIVANAGDTATRLCLEKLQGIPDYSGVFLEGPEAMDCIRPDTLLVVVDVNNFANVEYPPILRNVQSIAVVDHHRKTADFSEKPLITYIEASASSTSELVAEILELSLSTKSLLKEEAELLLSGILLDTQKFTRNTGTRTFGVARYLRGEGADPAATNELFKSDMDEVVKEAKFHSNVHIYRDTLAIAVCEDMGDASYGIAAAKAADKLLGVRNIEASFALVRVENKIHISARSAGRINVQLILEKLNGGGHFDVAGAKVESDDAYKVVEQLKFAIDEYLDESELPS